MFIRIAIIRSWRRRTLDMLSTPAPMPTSMKPALIAAATLATACRPDEHWRLSVASEVDSGKPA